MAEFAALNTAISADCTSLELNVAHGVSGAQSGDFCYDIAVEYGITLSPAVGDKCAGL
ncbi:hypothetical protein VMCG_10810 [Cytospora schulzeri]|uniref:Uncharacterized protein n=1 Tax=Cytospora schulzeri TaxID=448051 RepID=A0A423V7V3_9PEZI|nr:hypothetical protein VMCG_10810 [Valsa malicola]